MALSCPGCKSISPQSGPRIFARFGFYRRKSDRRVIPRLKCNLCSRTFSRATFDPCYRQLKRHKNREVFEQLASGVSQRRIAYLLRINRKTVKRKFIFIGHQAKTLNRLHNLLQEKASFVEFDELETFEHSKCKPLSVPLAVEGGTRRMLAFAVSAMPAKGLLAKKALKKYGRRKDERAQGRALLFTSLKDLVDENAVFKSDQNPHYPADVKRFFPKAQHITVKGKRGSLGGQGELKSVKFDPIFSLNHTCAKMRADINRLIRKTWCTTKRKDRLQLHIHIMMLYHNQQLLARKRV